MARFNWRHWLRAIRSRAADAIFLFVLWAMCCLNFFSIFDPLFQYKLAGFQQVVAVDRQIAIISRSQASLDGSRTDQRKALSKIIEQIGPANPKAVIVLEALDREVGTGADRELAQSIGALGQKVILLAYLPKITREVKWNLPLARFRAKARLGHNDQFTATVTHVDRITAFPQEQGLDSVRHIAVEAMDPALSPNKNYYFDVYRFWRPFFGYPVRGGAFSSSVDQRVRELKITRIDEDSLLAQGTDGLVEGNAIFVIEPIHKRNAAMLNKTFSQSDLAEQTALQLYSLKNGTRNYVQADDLAVLMLVLCSMIYLLRRGVFGFGFALALSAAWILIAYFLIPYSIYFSIAGPIAFFFTFAGISARRQAEKRGVQMAGKLHPISKLPNSVSFREAAIGPGQLVLAINSDEFAHPKFKPDQFFKRAFGERLPKTVFQTSDTTLTALMDKPTALSLSGKMDAGKWRDEALRVVALSPSASTGLDTIVADLEARFAELRSRGVPFSFIDNRGSALDAHPIEQADHTQQLFREVLVYDMASQSPVGAMVEVPKADDGLLQIKQLIDSQLKKQERLAANGGLTRGMWFSVDHGLLRDSAAIDYLASAVAQDDARPFISCVLLRGFTHLKTIGLEWESIRRLSRSGIQIGADGALQPSQSFADLVGAPVQLMTLDLKGLRPVKETASMLQAAKLLSDELARELYAENVGDAALAKMVSEAQVRYANGPAVAEFILANDRVETNERDAV